MNLSPLLTDSGKAMIIKALHGDSITFTKIKLGNGDGPSGENIGNPLIEIGITEIEEGDNYVVISGSYNNSGVDASFYANEIGIFAKNSNNVEFLYAYTRNEENADFIPGNNSNSVLETQISVVVSIGTAENVDAVLIEASAYASKEEFEEHVANKNNPHEVSAADVGLGNVENSALIDIVPDYSSVFGTVGTEELSYTDNVGKIFAKLKRAVKTLIDHVNNTTSHITATERTSWNSKAAGTHNHSASSINSGTLGIARGGTGASDAANARKNLGINAIYTYETVRSGIVNIASQNAGVNVDIAIPSKSGYSPVAIRSWSIENDETTGSRDTMIDLNNIAFNSSKVSAQLVNRYAGANHCKLMVSVLYLKNL